MDRLLKYGDEYGRKAFKELMDAAEKKRKENRISTLILKSRRKCLTEKTECFLLNEIFGFKKYGGDYE